MTRSFYTRNQCLFADQRKWIIFEYVSLIQPNIVYLKSCTILIILYIVVCLLVYKAQLKW